MKESEIIEHFSHHGKKYPGVILGIGDDCALVDPGSNHVIAATIDTMVAGVHFFPEVSPFNLGHKIMAVSLSDLAAMGATPRWALLALSLPKVEMEWLEQFTQGMLSILDRYQVSLVGGNTTSSKQIIISSQLLGVLPKNKALKRDGAKPGDKIFVTGSLGKAGLALVVNRRNRQETDVNKTLQASLQKALELPTPRVYQGQSLLGLANSAIDISDGLAADLTHILRAGHCAAKIYAHQLPIAEEVKQLTSAKQAINLALTGGDDYELCFTISPDKLSLLANVAKNWDCSVTEIGEITPADQLGDQLKVYDEQHQLITLSRLGYEHFG